MFQCLGLATEADGGCGEDWWHPECVLGLGRDWAKKSMSEPKQENGDTSAGEEDHDADNLPPGFPQEEDFEMFICYKCVDANPWIRRYAGSTGFLPATYKKEDHAGDVQTPSQGKPTKQNNKTAQHGEIEHGAMASTPASPVQNPVDAHTVSKKRKAEDDADELSRELTDQKRQKSESDAACRYRALADPPSGKLSLFLREDFRDHMCRCSQCYPTISRHPQLLEEEESYEPPLSEDGEEGNRSAGTGSLLDRGEAALSNVDRVRAIGMVLVDRLRIRTLTIFPEYRRCHGLQSPEG